MSNCQGILLGDRADPENQDTDGIFPAAGAAPGAPCTGATGAPRSNAGSASGGLRRAWESAFLTASRVPPLSSASG